MNRRRKLVPELLLAELAYKAELGVPIASLAKQLGCTRPTLANLIALYNRTPEDSSSETIISSLFPSWLTKDTIQEAPTTAYYIGFFPYGHWSYNENHTATN
jgi:hypothetical protein